MKLPSKVQVGPHTYQIEVRAEVDSGNRWGETDKVLRRIRFGLQCHPRQLPITLIHELIHACEEAYQVDLKEKEVTALANGLAQALMSLKILPKELDI